ncbi:MAG TPA: TIGR04282 family arsenosugar biosynthesis glycosyltransferase [Sphingobacteriaceae bacterium]|nr:TIGR04282 family arsenosugar biosynthesis glycosyltransferase [Sphingobacteriaceae bacterium]
MDRFLNTALIIFVRNPELGKVKTRLAKSIGDEKTLAIYQMLLKHTFETTRDVGCRKFVYYADNLTEYDLWNNPGYTKRLQQGDGLGERMKNAFNDLFEQGFKKVLIIGSDCLELRTDILSTAITKLDQADVIIGPAFDGGYYLLGMTSPVPELFSNVDWSTSHVLLQTTAKLDEYKMSYGLLEKLHDVDEAADLERSDINH